MKSIDNDGKHHNDQTNNINNLCPILDFVRSYVGLAIYSHKYVWHVLLYRAIYGLQTNREVNMAGYWLSSFFACLWTETKSRSIKRFGFILVRDSVHRARSRSYSHNK